MKRTVSLFVVLMLLVFAFAACGDGETVTDAPATDAPVTDVPATDAPTTDAPKTDAPTTDAPATDATDTSDGEGFDLPMVPV